MRGVLGLLGVVLALAVVGLLVKKQLQATQLPVVPHTSTPSTAPAGNVQEQSQQIQQQVKRDVEALMQAKPRPDADQ